MAIKNKSEKNKQYKNSSSKTDSHFYIIPVSKAQTSNHEKPHFFIVPINKIQRKKLQEIKISEATQEIENLSGHQLKSLGELLQNIDTNQSEQIIDIDASLLKKLKTESKKTKTAISDLIIKILNEHFK